MIYLDYNATAPVKPRVIERMAELMALPHNPSSGHKLGREARRAVEDARKALSERISCWPNEVIFTSGGTEANNWALKATGRRVLVAASEHASVLKATDATLIPVDENGLLNLTALEALLAGGAPALVSVMLANNETGVIQPLAEISKITKAHGALLHSDAVQAIGKIRLDFGVLGVDMLTLSAHKCGGPQGVGTLVVRQDLPISAQQKGGGQELGRRAGTENVAAIVGFAEALQEETDFAVQHGWLTHLEKELEAQGAKIFGKGAARLPNTISISMPDVKSETQLMAFDLAGVAVSAGSACSSGRVEVSHVLRAMGVEEEVAATAIRVSAGWNTTEAQLQKFAVEWEKIYDRASSAKARDSLAKTA